MNTETTGTQTRTRVHETREGSLVGLVLGVTGGAQRLRQALRRASRAVAAAVTPAGWLAIAAAVLGLLAGVILGWTEGVVVGVIALVLLILAVPFLFGARDYEVSLGVPKDRVVVGSTVTGTIRIRNRGSRVLLPGRLDVPVGEGLVELPVPLLRGGAETSRESVIPALRRGVVTIGPVTAVRSDPLGLLRRERSWADTHLLYVHPRTVALPTTSAGLVRDLEGNPTRQLVDADMSFHAIREYAPGDSRRQVHWKSTAKTGRLMVRQFEESRRSLMGIALSVREADFADADEFELAVGVAASLGAHSLREGRDLDIAVGAEIPRAVRGRLRAVRRLAAATSRGLLDEFCTIERLESTLTLDEVCRVQGEGADGLSIAFLVTGSAVDLTALRRASLHYSTATAVVAILCDERATPSVRRVGTLTVVTVGLLDDLAPLLRRGVSE